MNRSVTTRLALLFGAAIAGPAAAQCTPDWLPTPSIPGITGSGSVTCATTWDPDGPGPLEELLVIGGGFEAAGNVLTGGLAAWNGKGWSSLGGPAANVLAVYNGDLVAAGFFMTAGGVPAQRIARYDGTAWHPLGAGLNQTVRAMTVYNGELIVGGFFTDAGGGTADYIARWNGASWLPVGAGVNDVVTALTVHDGALIAGGGFSTAGGQAADNVARWNGSAWTGYNDAYDVIQIDALTSYQGALIASGTFVQPLTSVMDFVVRWTGSAWQELGGGTNDHVFSFCEYNKELICGGLLTNAGGTSAFHLARWNGSFWSPVFAMPGVGALAEYRGDLIIGGRGLKANMEPMSLVLRWNGVSVGHLGRGTDGAIFDFETYNGDLIAAGEFGTIGNAVAPAIARWSQGEWHALGGGPGVGALVDLAVFDGSLIAAGTAGTARWDGAAWHPFGFATVAGMHVHGGNLYAALGQTGPNGVGRWNAATQTWDPVGLFSGQVFIAVLTTWNGDLVAGGFGNAANAWRLDEGEWVPLGTSMGLGAMHTLVEYNGELIAGGFIPGTFTNILNGLARFNGTDWVAIGGGMFQNNSEWSLFVSDLLVHDGVLIVSGGFTHAGHPGFGGIEANNIAAWNGTSWSALGEGTNDPALALHAYAGDVHVGGWFHKAGGKPAGHWARWGCDACYADCNSDGVLTAADFGCFQTKFVAGDPYADCNGDGGFTVQDFGCFQTRFVAGCP